MARKNCILLFRKITTSNCQTRLFSSGVRKDYSVRVRFAPSPTGLLHLGGFRTALLNYLFALKHDGRFILRIEDTDQTRLVPGALKRIQDDLKWLGIEPHESPQNPGKHGPYIQSERLSIYHENLQTLIDSGHAYECFCTEKRLDLMRREAMKLRQKPRYDNKCRELTRDEVKAKKAAGEKWCVRFKLQPEHVILNDMVYGKIEFDLTGMLYEGDPVIVKSDGYPTYHFANVVDDHYMEISHVLRGVEWQISTPKHLQMFRSFKWEPPEYAHLPLVMNSDGTKLSKRQGDVSINHYREQTYYPIVLANFVTKSGGGFSYHGVDKLLGLENLASTLDMGQVNTGGCKLDFALLDHLNQLELEREIKENLTSASNSLRDQMRFTKHLNVESYSSSYFEKVLRWCTNRVSRMKDLLSPEFEYLWSQPSSGQLTKISTSPEVIQQFASWCENESFWDSSDNSEYMSQALEKFCSQHNVKQKAFLKDLRLILCGLTKGPPIVELFQLFGKDVVYDRLLKSMKHLDTQSEIHAAQQGQK